MNSGQTRTYQRATSVVFLKTNEEFGGLSNMAGGFPLRVNGVRILTSEALYQACRFPHLPEVQRLIIDQRSPMTAKMKSKPYRRDSRPDWRQVRTKIMRWCLHVKLAQNWLKFSELLLETDNRPIVEQSRKDDFWGAKPVDDNTLVGMNVLGRLLMELREAVNTETRETLCFVEPLAIPGFLLGGKPIGVVATQVAEMARDQTQADAQVTRGDVDSHPAAQQSLFDERAVKDPPLHANPRVKEGGGRIAELKPYPKYKSSAQAWLGEIPLHWTVLPNRALFEEVKDRGHPNEEMLSVTIRKGIILQKAHLEGSSKKDSSNLDKSAYKLVQPRDIAYNKMRAWQGAIGASEHRGIISPAYVVMRLRKDDDLSSYFHHLYRTPKFAKEAERWSYGITSDMWSLRPEHFKVIYSPRPPPAEQEAIVRFLDWANGRLERAIRAKRKTIALLDEQKQAIIHRAVTRGLDLSVHLKPSGIPWLGDIPQHWEVRRLRTLVHRIDQGVSPLAVGFLAEGNSWGVLKSGCVNKGVFRETEHKQLARDFEIDPAIVVNVGDVLISRACGSPSLVGSVGRVKSLHYKLILSDKTFRARFLDCADVDFMVFAMNCRYYRQQVEQAISGAEGMANNLPLSSLRDFSFAIPPAAEAAAIAESIEDETAQRQRTVGRLEREIELLHEYRTRLIADVVTGKVDVREAAVRLPDEEALQSVEDDTDLANDLETADETVA